MLVLLSQTPKALSADMAAVIGSLAALQAESRQVKLLGCGPASQERWSECASKSHPGASQPEETPTCGQLRPYAAFCSEDAPRSILDLLSLMPAGSASEMPHDNLTAPEASPGK